jgi:hypothetical protein
MLTVRAGPVALSLIRRNGLRPEDVDIVPGASGGAKWLVLSGIDRYLAGDFLTSPREKPLHLIGSSIGSWRMAAYMLADPVAALGRGHSAYIYDQDYEGKPTAREISDVGEHILDTMLGPVGIDEVLGHPSMRLHVITSAARGLAGSARRGVVMFALGIAAAANLVSRRTLALQLRRVIFHSAGDESPFRELRDFPTTHRALTRDNLRMALLASAAIPLVLEGVRIPGEGGARDALHWDGGVVDYHLDIPFGAGQGIVLYPHFYSHVVPGWFDKGLSWRRARPTNFARALLIAPSDEFVAKLPGAKIPDRHDFHRFPHAERKRRWQAALDGGEALGEHLRELVTSGRIADVVTPW